MKRTFTCIALILMVMFMAGCIMGLVFGLGRLTSYTLLGGAAAFYGRVDCPAADVLRLRGCRAAEPLYQRISKVLGIEYTRLVGTEDGPPIEDKDGRQRIGRNDFHVPMESLVDALR